MVQLLLEDFTLSDVLEGHYRAHHLAVLEYGGAHILDRKARAVLPPEHLVIPTVGGSILEHRMDWTLFTRIGGAVRFRMVEDVMLGTASHPVMRAAAGLTNVAFPSRSSPKIPSPADFRTISC